MKYLTIFVLIFFYSHSYAVDYYWVGGSGDWSDLSHWATTSGGSVFHAQVPTSNDNVIFDGNSFSANGQTVTFNNDIVFFRDMDWSQVSSNVVLRGGNSVIINCYGSIDLGDNVNFIFPGTLVFTGENTGNSINLGNNLAAKEVYFAGNGDWTFEEHFAVDSILQIESGGINTNGFDVRCEYLYIVGNRNKNISLGNSEIEVWGNYGDREFYGPEFDTITAKINTDNLNFDAGNSTINFTSPLIEIWFTGSSSITFFDVNFTSNFGRNYLRLYNSNPTINYNTLRLNGRARLEGNQNMNNLILNRNKVYRLQSGRTYDIGNIDAIGTCAEGIIITSSDAGSPAIVDLSSEVTMDFVTLRDIDARGMSINANNSTDLGNNNNIAFTNSNTLDYYWIGGTGNWTDPAHWSLSSGGPSSGCIPAGKDNAIFDANSFNGANQSVTLDLEDIFIRDMIWDGVTGNPDLTGGLDTSMHITGSLRFDENMDHTFGGYYYFESSLPDNTIEVNGKGFNRELHFSGQGAEWDILDDIYVTWHVIHQSGIIRTNGNTIEAWKYESRGSLPRHLDMSNSTFLIHDVLDEYGNAVYRPEWVIESNNYTTITDGSTIEFISSHFVGFDVYGPNILEYNNLIFSSYGGNIYGYNNNNFMSPSTNIDTVIMRMRGAFYNTQAINYLELTAGFDYEFENNTDFYINELNANGSCAKGHIQLLSNSPGDQAFFHISSDHTFDRFIVQDMANMDSGILTANNSVDNGNNSGWVFDTLSPRTLFWVGNTGAWEDSTHWSLSSGGPGGECIPTSIDNVVFDENSFDQPNQSVYSEANRVNVCHDMTWQNVFGNPTFGYFNPGNGGWFYTDFIKIYGSLTYDQNMNVGVYWHLFYTEEEDQVISNGVEISGLVMRGFGELTLSDDLTCWSLEQSNGTLIFNDIEVNTNQVHFYNNNQNPLFTYFNNSTIYLGRNVNHQTTFSDVADFHFLDIGTTTLYFQSNINYLISNVGTELFRVVSTLPSGIIYIADRFLNWDKPLNTNPITMQYINMAGDGYFLGETITDTLIGAPGKTYTLESGETQTVNKYLQLIGNNCTPIQLQATISGTLAEISMPPTGEILVDFIEMKDNNGTGGAEFIAGARSTDIGMSNRGWIFEDPPEYVETGFLGVDRALCNNASLTLNAFNYSPNESYQWNDNSTDTTYLVNSTGTYSVTVTFDNGCTISDEIIILEPQDVEVDLGPDSSIICEGTSIVLDGTIGIQGVNYQWNDGEESPIKEISESGKYILSAEVDGCFTSDSAVINVQETPIIDLGMDQAFCEGDNFTLDASYSGASYQWQDGSTNPTFQGNTAGLYWAEVVISGCSYRDSISINFVPTPPVNIGNDTTLCVGQSVILTSSDVDDATFTWQDGSVGQDYEVTDEGPYVLTVDVMGCMNSDSIYITYQDAPDFELGQDISACEGDVVTISTSTMADAYFWNTGDQSNEITVDSSGNYTLEITVGECILTDNISISFNSYPIVELGDDLIQICDGEAYLMDAGAVGTWQDDTESQTYEATVEGWYKVSVSNDGCITEDSLEIEILPLPEVTFQSEMITVCEGDEYILTAPNTNYKFIWDDGSNDPDRSIYTSGTYWFEAIDNGCTNRDSISLIFNELPSIDLGADTTVCDDANHIIIPNVSTGNIIWMDGSTTDNFIVTNPGWVSAQIEREGCFSSDSVFIDFKTCNYFDAYIPNIFSPNENGRNEFFNPTFQEGVEILDYKLVIFDRWGNKVFTSNSLDESWNGRYDNANANTGVYVYIIEVSYRDDREMGDSIITGDVLVVK